MSGVRVILDDADVLGALGQLQRAAEHPRAAMDAIGAHFVFSSQQNIEHETSPAGVRWPPLSPRTANRRLGKGRRGYDHMLRVTTRLYRSINYNADDTSVEWGSNVAYALVHQEGGLIDIPPRQGRVTLKSIRKKGGGVRSRFVRTGTKGATEKTVSIRGYQIRVPARPYLGISNFDRTEVQAIVADYLRTETSR